MTDRVDIPIFPLNTVLYPGGRLPLRIFEMRYVDMTKACIGNDEVFGVCQILDGREAGVPALFAPLGCSARITTWEVPSPGLFSLVTTGERVFRVHEHRVTRAGLIRAEVEFLPAPEPLELPTAYAALGRFTAEIVAKLGREHFAEPLQLEDAAWVCHRLAEILPFERDTRLDVLEATDAREKLALVEAALQRLDQQR